MKRNRKKAVVLVIAAAIIVAVIIGVYVTRPDRVTNYNSAGAEFEEEQTASESTGAESGVEAGIQIPGYKSITIPSGTTDVSVELTNPEENKVYFKIAFYLPETDETIYSSKLIRPGQTLYDITLTREMEAGEYPLTVIYSTYTADDEQAPRNGAEVNCTLIVQ